MDEICVQVQAEYSFHWNVYEETVKMFIESYVAKEPIEIKHLLSYYDEYSYPDDNSMDTNNEIKLIFNEGYIIDTLFIKIEGLAADYTNARINNYLDHSY